MFIVGQCFTFDLICSHKAASSVRRNKMILKTLWNNFILGKK
jgi:hypothetical protein